MTTVEPLHLQGWRGIVVWGQATQIAQHQLGQGRIIILLQRRCSWTAQVEADQIVSIWGKARALHTLYRG